MNRKDDYQQVAEDAIAALYQLQALVVARAEDNATNDQMAVKHGSLLISEIQKQFEGVLNDNNL